MTSWQAFAVASAFFAGLTAVLGKLGVEGLNSNLATLIRTVVIFVVTVAIVTWRHEWTWPRGAELRPVTFLVLSGVATGLSWLFYYRALQMAPASLVAPIDKLSVVFVAIFAFLFLGERLAAVNWMGIALIGAGAVLVAL